MRDMNADAGIGRTRSSGDKSNAGPSGHRAVCAGHESHAAFLPAGHQINLVAPVERVEHLQKAFARNCENAVCALLSKAINEQPSCIWSGA